MSPLSVSVWAGAHKRKERSAAIYPNVNSVALSDDVYYQQSKESDVGSLAIDINRNRIGHCSRELIHSVQNRAAHPCCNI